MGRLCRALQLRLDGDEEMSVSDRAKFVVDCEYDDLTKTLISMAIVPLWPPVSDLSYFEQQDQREGEFYEVIEPFPQQMSDWVRENVLPKLRKPGIDYRAFQAKLQNFLLTHGVEELHYDWCEDIAYFNRALITGPGERLQLPATVLTKQEGLVTKLVHVHHTDIVFKGIDPHFALDDARMLAVAIKLRFLNY